MNSIGLVFPHQLFERVPFHEDIGRILLVEEFLFFRQYKFHKQKICFHRASMKAYQEFLHIKGFQTEYIQATEERSDVRILLTELAESETKKVHVIDPTDDWLMKRLRVGSESNDLDLVVYDSPLFINSAIQNETFFDPSKKTFFQTKFYTSQRKRLEVLLDSTGGPIGGKWSFDQENRMKYPKGKVPPLITFPKVSEYFKEAVNYTRSHFAHNPGELEDLPFYPIDFAQSKSWFEQFLIQRFVEFGPYEDAIVKGEVFLNHSVLSPLINVGLITTEYVVQSTIEFFNKNEVPINSAEGFIRQIIGWREFIRGIYESKGSEARTKNYWGFERKIPPSFYDGTTGIEPIDVTVKKVLKTGYCHHIERLMVIGNFMLLCEFHPEEVYRWFMELFIDAYDWVMVPNVYGMSQYADGGIFATKPYISGSNYLLKMSDYKRGQWADTWDALFWRFMHVHRDYFTKNPRLGMLVRTFDKWPVDKKRDYLSRAESYLESLDLAL